jgi:hypothetical protein
VAQQADLAGRGVFSRPASGLIRVAGSADVFIYNVGLVSVGIAIALNQYYGWPRPAWPGSGRPGGRPPACTSTRCWSGSAAPAR